MSGPLPGSAEVRTFAVTVPAGTAIAAPQVTDLDMPARLVDWIGVKVPPGPGGEVGFAFGLAGQPLIPVDTGSWIIADNESFTWQVSNLPTSGAWQVFAYNTGTYDHTLYVRLGLSLPYGPAPAPAPAVPDLSGLTSFNADQVAALTAEAEAGAGAVA